MGQVWQATDTQLNRQVALKILPDAFADDPDRLARFTREAQILASLNHPNIAAIHGIEEADGTRALVLELVEGPTLADRIAEGPIPIDEALPIAKQIAEALEAAHEQGVIHRDLKPANIKVREDGTVKVLDFGLAKALDPNPEGDPNQSPTLTAAATQMGVIMGTAAYMSPEQARGKTVDKRADIWAFGAVLYEMLSGRRAFVGDDVSSTFVSVFRDAPDWSRLSADVPTRVRQAIQVCWQKDPRQRVQAIGDVRLAIEGAFETTVGAPPDQGSSWPLHVWQRPIPAVVALVAALALGALVARGLWRFDVVPAGMVRFTIVPPETAQLNVGGPDGDVAVSPDGTQIVYVGSSSSGFVQLNLRPIDQLVGSPLKGTDDGENPFFSPDGEWVGFHDFSGTTLRKVSTLGGAPVTMAESPSGIRGASWGDEWIIFGTDTAGLFRVSGEGGDAEVLTTPDTEEGEQSHAWPSIIPRGAAVVFVIATDLAPLNGGQLAVLDLDTGEVKRLGLVGVSPHYVSTGHLVYAVADGSMRAVTFDARSLDVTGTPVPLLERVVVKDSGAADFALSMTGTLFYVPDAGPDLASRLVMVGRNGVVESPLDEVSGNAWYPRFSPDGSRVAFAIAASSGAGGGADLWVLDIDRNTQIRLTVGDTDTVADNNRFFRCGRLTDGSSRLVKVPGPQTASWSRPPTAAVSSRRSSTSANASSRCLGRRMGVRSPCTGLSVRETAT